MSIATAVASAEVLTEYRVLPLGDLHPHPRNLRVDLGDLSGLVSSITDGGVRQPLRVAPRDQGGYWIVVGHRRHAAAVQAGLPGLPCVIETSERAAAADVTDMLVENTQREDLNDAERVHGVQQLLELGLSATAIGQRTGLGSKNARQLAGVARDPVARQALQEGLTLEHALIVARFSGDEQAQAQLLGHAAEPWQFKRVVAALQAEAKLTTEVEKLCAAGVVACSRDQWEALDHPAAAPLSHLVDEQGRPFPQDYDHSGCDGHVVVVQLRTWNEAIDIEQLCRDPQANGHSVAEWARARSDSAADVDDPAAKEAQREERRRVIRCNREWRAARTVRRQHLREVLQRRSAPQASLALITTLAAEGAHNDAPSVLAELLGIETADGAWRPQRDLLTAWLGETPADPRRTLALVAMFVAHVEQQELHDNRWRNPAQGGRAEAYLDWLVQHTGYSLSPVEALAIGRVTQDDVDAAHAQGDQPQT